MLLQLPQQLRMLSIGICFVELSCWPVATYLSAELCLSLSQRLGQHFLSSGAMLGSALYAPSRSRLACQSSDWTADICSARHVTTHTVNEQ